IPPPAAHCDILATDFAVGLIRLEAKLVRTLVDYGSLLMFNKISTRLMAVRDVMSERFFLSLGIFLFVILFSTVASCLAQEGNGGDGLVAYWKFEEGAGGAVKDSSGNGNDGTIIPTNTPEPKWGAGEFTGSVSLSGCDDHHVRIPSSESLNKLKRQITVV